MDKKVLGILLVIAVLIAASWYFLLPRNKEPPKLNNVWQEKIDELYLHHSPEKIFKLQDVEIYQIRNKLLTISQSSDDAEERDLAEIYALYLDYLLKLRESYKKIDSASSTNFCDNVKIYEETLNIREEATKIFEELNNKIVEFNLKYREHSEKIKLFSSEDLITYNKDKTKYLKNMLESFSSVC